MTHTLLILLLIVFQAQAQAPQQSKSAKEYFDSAVARLQKEDLDGTIADMTKAIELNPRYVDAIFIRGQCLFLKGDRDRALLDYDKVIELAPTAPGVERVYNTRSVIRVLKGDVAGAIPDLQKAIELNPNYADSFSNRGLTRWLQGDQSGAAADYEKALELNPNLEAAYINRGILRFDRQILDGAMADFNRALELAPNAAKPYVDRAVLHTLAGEVDLALADLKKASALDATSLSEKDPGIMSSPFKRLQSFISSNPKNARAYEARGLLRLIQGRRSEATRDFTKSLELNPKLRSEIDRLMSITF
jgi:tetratricopeptide (TPR) repeat protein